ARMGRHGQTEPVLDGALARSQQGQSSARTQKARQGRQQKIVTLVPSEAAHHAEERRGRIGGKAEAGLDLGLVAPSRSDAPSAEGGGKERIHGGSPGSGAEALPGSRRP